MTVLIADIMDGMGIDVGRLIIEQIAELAQGRAKKRSKILPITAIFPPDTCTAGMAREPPVELSQPPDKDHLERYGKSNKTQLATPHNSSYSSSNSQNTEAINTATSERELDGTIKIISPEVHVSIHGKSIAVTKSSKHDLYSTKNPTDYIVPIERSRDANLERNANKSPEVHPQIRRSLSQVLADSTTGDYSPQMEVHPTEILSEMDGGIIGEEDSGETRGQLAGVYGTSDRGINSTPMDIHLLDISNNVNGGTIRNTNLGQSMHILSKQQDTNQSNEAQSSDFSFGIVGKSMNLTSPLSSDAMQAQELGQGHQEQHTESQDNSNQNKITEKNKDNQQQKNGQLDQGQQSQGKAMQTGHIQNETNGRASGE
ncbi:hypothetical protein H5410_013504 [Solanum commersonii]|uniref:Uncharacterized protein n=1 Tax=Solanum commersonii TaxID=4109 RepID=A0A9J5ZNF2_SOLCO|nr:hypothetical protein H5410_013504 [Solanum commersonii]